MRYVHFVGSIGLDTAEEVFSTVGKALGRKIKRCPDGEVGGRRMWISWQYPLLRSSPYLKIDENALIPGVGMCLMELADGVDPADVHFGELGYVREAVSSYRLFCAARDRGDIATGVRFQVSLPTPAAVIFAFLKPEAAQAVYPVYEATMLREAEKICAAIPHDDLAVQWDTCIEMVMWDGRGPFPQIPDMENIFRATFGRLAAPVPGDVPLGFHLCYGDMDAEHFAQPEDTRKAVELGNLITESVGRAVNWIHLPAPADRDDEEYYKPLAELERGPETELYIGLVHAGDGVDGTRRRMEAASKTVEDFGIATECGIARVRTRELVEQLIRIHAEAAD